MWRLGILAVDVHCRPGLWKLHSSLWTPLSAKEELNVLEWVESLTAEGPPGGSAAPARQGQSLQCEKATTRGQSRDNRFHYAAGCLATVTQRAPSLHPPQGLQVISGITDLHKEWPQESQNCFSFKQGPQIQHHSGAEGIGLSSPLLGMPGIRKKR